MTKDEAIARYYAAAHAIQSGVLAEMHRGSNDTNPKHLRVGVNLRAVDQAALVGILIRKGLITELEYLVEVALEAEREKERYESRLGLKLG